MRLNTIGASKQLQNVGVEESHADAFVKLVYDAEEQLATKADIDRLRSEIKQSRSDTNSEIGKLRSEFYQSQWEMKEEYDELRIEFAGLKTDIHWLAAIHTALLIGGVSIAIAIAI